MIMTRAPLDPTEQRTLLALARESIRHGLEHGMPLAVDIESYEPNITRPGAAFVTLEDQGGLRGCIGSVEAHRPLVEDVVRNAWNAAFRDPRFTPLTVEEMEDIHIDISILTEPEEMDVSSEEDLKEQLVPYRDGLIISEGFRRGLFLPTVWEKLPEVDSFLSHLKEKAGFPWDYWSEGISCERFFSFAFSEEDLP